MKTRLKQLPGRVATASYLPGFTKSPGTLMRDNRIVL